jgi:hypothetical protein
MAKTLVGVYDTLAEAECVVVDLIEHDFVGIAMRRMPDDAQGQETDEAYFSEELRAAEVGVIDELTELGVPVDEARSYAVELLQGGVLVMVRASDTTAECGIELMNRRHLADGRAKARKY